MANIRVKDLPNTNSAADTDEFIIDSSTAGTRRLSYSELKSEISTDFQGDVNTHKIATLASDNKLDPSQIPDTLSQGLNFVGVANSAGDLTSTTQGDFYVIQTAFGVYSVGDQAVYNGASYTRVTDGTKQIAEGGTGATTLDAAKGNLEIADVGSAPNQVPLNSMLSGMAYMSPEAVSVAELEVTDKVDGSLGINTSPTATLEVTDATTNVAAVRVTRRSDLASTYGEIGTTGGSAEVRSTDNLVLSADFDNNGGSSNIEFKVDGSQKAVIDGTGVGIGTASPSAGAVGGKVVHVQSTGETASVRVDRSDASTAGTLSLTAGNSTLGIYGTGSKDLVFSTNGTSRATIDSTGNLTVSSGQMQVTGGAASAPSYAFDGDTDTGMSRPTTNSINFVTGGTERWRINSSGNLVANSTGIDFGSTNTNTGVTVTGSVMSEYEVGFWTPSFITSGSGFTTAPTMDVVNARYARVGDLCHFYCYLKTDSVDLTGAGTYLLLTGLPYAASASSSHNFASVNVGYATQWANAPAGGYVASTATFIYLTKRSSSVTGALAEMSPSDLTAGTAADQNRLMISGSYVIA